MASPEINPGVSHRIPVYVVEEGKTEIMMVPQGGDKPPMGPAVPLVDKAIPPDYKGIAREVKLLNGATTMAYAVFSEQQAPYDEALEGSSEAIVYGFIHALQKEFDDDPEPSDEERGIEIGNIYAFALSCGLTEYQTVTCYNTAFCMTTRAYLNDN